MRFYIIYEKSFPYDDGSGDGVWELCYNSYEHLLDAEDRMRWLRGQPKNFRRIIGPLFLARSLDKSEESGKVE